MIFKQFFFFKLENAAFNPQKMEKWRASFLFIFFLRIMLITSEGVSPFLTAEIYCELSVGKTISKVMPLFFVTLPTVKLLYLCSSSMQIQTYRWVQPMTEVL